MPGAYIRGVGVSCALGEDLGHCVTALQDIEAHPVELQLQDFAEPIQLRYYRIPDHAELFEPGRFQRILSKVVRDAVQNAGLTDTEIRQLPLFVGSSCFSIGLSESDYAQALAGHSESAIPMPLCGYQDIAAIAQQALGGSGDTYMYNTACTSSANAMLGALRMLEQGWYQHALVIGAEFANRTTLAGFAGLQLLAGTVQPFDVKRSGIVLGEGVGAVVISAQRQHEENLRVLGGASNCDTSSVTTAHPDGSSVAAVLRQALAGTRLQPDQIRGIKAHGTATPSGDTAEANGMHAVFETLPPLTVLKPYLGHTLGACGINELVLFGSALQNGFMPATPGFASSDPDLGVRPLLSPAAAPEGCYLLNHFGFGGNNTVLVLEKTAS